MCAIIARRDRPMTQLALISLFCGPGGMDEGFAQAGFSPLLAYDVDEAAVCTYNYNQEISFSFDLDDEVQLAPGRLSPELLVEFEKRNQLLSPEAILIGKPGNQKWAISDCHRSYRMQINNQKVTICRDDIARRVDLSTIPADEVLTEWGQVTSVSPAGVIGGPPCQSFSFGNAHQRHTDPRHYLPEHYALLLRTINEHYELDFFVFENVPGLVTKKHLEKFTHFKKLFQQAGFRIFEGSLDTADFGVAQVRPRVFVVGLNKRRYPDLEFVFPKGNNERCRTVRDVIGHLPDPVYFSKFLTETEILHHPNHWCLVPRSSKFADGFLQRGTRRGRSFQVLNWDAPSYTVAYGHNEVHIHPDCRRRLSVYEAMLLQGFPDDYVLKGTLTDQIHLVSQAVSPPVARALAHAIGTQLGLFSANEPYP